MKVFIITGASDGIGAEMARQLAKAHGAQAGLVLDSLRGIRQGGNSGAAIQPGDPGRSLMLRALRHTDKNQKMPPGKPLAPEVVAEF